MEYEQMDPNRNRYGPKMNMVVDIVKNELKRVKEKQKIQRGQQVSRDIVDKIVSGDGSSAVEFMKDELDARTFLKIEPDIKRAGSMMEEHMFSNDK